MNPATHVLPQILFVIHLANFISPQPIDFQVGSYLHKFFKGILPNNTEFKRKPWHEDPYKKYSRPTEDDPLPTIEGLKFKMADDNFPTFHTCNLTFVTYNPFTTTLGTTPEKESILNLAKAFKGVFMQKSGIVKQFGEMYKEYVKLKNKTTSRPVKKVEDANYDEKLDTVLNKVNLKMVKKVHQLFNLTAQTTPPPSILKNFLENMKSLYRNQVDSLFVKNTPKPEIQPVDLKEEVQPVEIKEEVTDSTTGQTLASQELKDEEHMKELHKMDKEFRDEKELQEDLKDIYTPGPHEV
ncbi:hypothetical protein M8J77_018829 [Diaphorina citri]|nr:hypothetical protein M8J77_018829 [Diaphorina citri]